MNLTSRQSEIVRFIWNYRKIHGIAPTLSEIAETLKVSKITVHEHIGLLEKKGAIKKEKYQSRSLTLSRAVIRELEAVEKERSRLGLGSAPIGERRKGEKASNGALRAVDAAVAAGLKETKKAKASSGGGRALPLLGKIAAGSPIEALEDTEELDIDTTLRLDRASYALRVKGDSMIDDGIHDGDYVLVERRTNPRDGETVVAILEGNEATLKRFFKEKDGYRLVPANARMEPISIAKDKLEIRGVVVGQLRRY